MLSSLKLGCSSTAGKPPGITALWLIQFETIEVFLRCRTVTCSELLQAVLQRRENGTWALQRKEQQDLSLLTALQHYSCCWGGWGVSGCLLRLAPKQLPPHHTCCSAEETCNILTLIKVKTELATQGTKIWVAELFFIWCATTYHF